MLARVRVRLQVSDLGKSRSFYEKFLGVTAVEEGPGELRFLPEIAALCLVLSAGEPGTSARPATGRFGIELDRNDTVRRHLKRLQAAGLQVCLELDVYRCYAQETRFSVSDPDGVEWQVSHVDFDSAGNAPRENEIEEPVRPLEVVATGPVCQPGKRC